MEAERPPGEAPWSSNDGSSTTVAAWSCRPGGAAGKPGVAAVAAGVAEDRAAGIAWRWMQHQKVEPQGHGGRQVQQMDAAASEVGLSCSHSVLVGSNWRSACAASLQVDVKLWSCVMQKVHGDEKWRHGDLETWRLGGSHAAPCVF